MLGGGNFTALNKGLPGTYMNFVSAANRGELLSERGTAAIPMVLDWGPERQVFEVSVNEYQERCQEIFGYPSDAPEMWPVRELFKHLTKGVFYRINSGVKAACDYGEAKYSGIRGKALSLVISPNVNDETKFDVKTLMDRKEVDRQTVEKADQLQDNLYVVFKKDATLEATAGIPLTGGTNGETATGKDYTEFLEKIESYSFQILCCPVLDEVVKGVFIQYTKRLRDEAGVKFQTVVYKNSTADYEGVISVENSALQWEQGLVYWVAGIQAACEVNKTNENKVYDGELTVNTDYTQEQLLRAVQTGKYMFHKVGDSVRVLMDLNTYVTFTEEKGEDFSSNQTIRVLDQIGNDIAGLFQSRYLGTMPNDESGRVSLWNDIVTYMKRMSDMRAIEDVVSKHIVIDKGQTKRSVVVNLPVVPVHCMSQLYMTVVVS